MCKNYTAALTTKRKTSITGVKRILFFEVTNNKA